MGDEIKTRRLYILLNLRDGNQHMLYMLILKILSILKICSAYSGIVDAVQHEHVLAEEMFTLISD